MRIMGIDPGTRITGYGIIEERTSLEVVDYGCIRPPPSLMLSDRYLLLFEALEELIKRHHPEVVVVETQYVARNPQSALKLGMARGVVIIAAKREKIPVIEYAPSRAKKAVVGHGGASKVQVQQMVMRLLSLKEAPMPEDASDALALAIAHANGARCQTLVGEAL